MLTIGIAGGTASGKTVLVEALQQHFAAESIAIVPQDTYYKDNSHLPLVERQAINFDHPDSIDFDLLTQHVKQLQEGKTIQVPEYSYKTCTRTGQFTAVASKPILIVEGILLFTQTKLCALLDMKVFIDVDADERLMRCVHRDGKQRNRTMEQVFDRYQKTVKPMYDELIAPSKKKADIIIVGGGKNTAGLRLLQAVIEQELRRNSKS
ncbi:MAG: uridine kinase [Chitinophagales bacterium]